jgi:hypothetical protein
LTRHKPGSESGQALLLIIVGMSLFIFGALGLGIDGAMLYVHRQMAQSAADAAAQAGIMSIYDGTNATGSNTFATGSPAASFTCTTSDARTPCVYARYNGFGGSSDDTVTVSFPATITGASLSSASVPAITVTVQRAVHGGIIQILGLSSTTIKAKASAAIVGSVPSSCIYTLDPSASGAFNASNGATVTSDCAIEVKSSSSSGGTITGGATVTASGLHGKFSISNGGSSNPAPSGSASAVADPFISLPAPTVGSSCDAQHTNYSPGFGTWTLNPGTFCGGITIGNGSTATFNAGTYVIKGGTLNLGGGATVTGSGVTFYLTGTNATYGSVTISNGVNITLTAPTSGTYIGILFYQDRSITSNVNATFAGGVALKLTGSLYFPTTTVSIQNGASSDGYDLAIVAQKVSFTGGAHFTYDPTGAKTGLAIKAVALIE